MGVDNVARRVQPLILSPGHMVVAGEWTGQEYISNIGPASIAVIPGLVTLEEVQALRAALSRYDTEFAKGKLDSTDGLPAFEVYISRPQPEQHDAIELKSLFAPIVEGRLTPFVKDRYNCSSCKACHWHVRRYREGEKLEMDAHFDVLAFATGVVDLSLGKYDGGLHVRDAQGKKSSEKLVPLTVGDACVHLFDLQHSVNVSLGERWSLVVWFQDDPDCRGPRTDWHENASYRGDPVAQFHLGRLLQHNDGYTPGRVDLEQSSIAARKWYRKSAEQGIVMSQVQLGAMLADGSGGPVDFLGAVKWMRKAAKRGNKKAQYNLGLLLSKGSEEVAPDMRAAFDWFQEAATNGHARASYTIGMVFLNGRGTPDDLRQAARWFQAAASKNDADAQVQLSRLLMEGRGITKNQKVAVDWLRRAATQNSTDAYQELSLAYEHGRGVKKNRKTAASWLAKVS